MQIIPCARREEVFRAIFTWWLREKMYMVFGSFSHISIAAVVSPTNPTAAAAAALRVEFWYGKPSSERGDVLVIQEEKKKGRLCGVVVHGLYTDHIIDTIGHAKTVEISRERIRPIASLPRNPRVLDVICPSSSSSSSEAATTPAFFLEPHTTLALAAKLAESDAVGRSVLLRRVFGTRDDSTAGIDATKIASAATQLVALGVCDRGYRQIAKTAFSIICMATRCAVGESEFGILRSLVAAVVVVDAAPPGGIKCAAPFYIRSGGADAYIFDQKLAMFVRLSDGLRVTLMPPGHDAEIWRVLRQTLRCSRHRNNLLHRELAVLVLPAIYGVARDSKACKTCKGVCAEAMGRPIILGDAALLTMSDFLVVSRAVARQTFDTMVRDACIRTDAAGLATLCADTAPDALLPGWKSVEKAVQSRSENLVRIKNASEKTAEGICRTADMLTQTLRRGAEVLERDYGLWIEDVFQDERLATVAARLQTVAVSFFDNLAEATARALCVRAGENAAAASSSRLSFGIDGIADIEQAGWSLYALRPWVPPCIGHVLDTGVVSRQRPKYHERMFVGSFMCSITGLVECFDNFYATWKSIFCGEDPSTFDGLEYGRRTAEDILRCCAKGVRRGCPHAIRNGICPFQAPVNRERLIDIEDHRQQHHRLSNKDYARVAVPKSAEIIETVLAAPISQTATPEQICKTRCAKYLSEISHQIEEGKNKSHNNNNNNNNNNAAAVTIVMTSSPEKFYSTARRAIPL